MMTSSHAPVASAEHAKALLARAAHSDNFFDSYGVHFRRPLEQALTRKYSPEDAAADDTFAEAEELAGLRAETCQRAGTFREDLSHPAFAVWGLTAAPATFVAQHVDIARAYCDRFRTFAGRMKNQDGHVSTARVAVEQSCGGWWCQLLWWLTSQRLATSAWPSDFDAAGTNVGMGTALTIAMPVPHDSQRAKEALTALAAELQGGASPALGFAGQASNAREAAVGASLVRLRALRGWIRADSAMDLIPLLAEALGAVVPAHRLSIAPVHEARTRLPIPVQAADPAPLTTPLSKAEVAGMSTVTSNRETSRDSDLDVILSDIKRRPLDQVPPVPMPPPLPGVCEAPLGSKGTWINRSVELPESLPDQRHPMDVQALGSFTVNHVPTPALSELFMLAAAHSEPLTASHAGVAYAAFEESDPLVYPRERLASHGDVPPAGAGVS